MIQKKVDYPITPNWANRTMWTGDNLDIMRDMNSECVDLIYLDPPFNLNRNYVGSGRRGPGMVRSRSSSRRCMRSSMRRGWRTGDVGRGRIVQAQWQNDRPPLVSYKAHMKAHRSGAKVYHGKRQEKHGRTARHRTGGQTPVTASAGRIGESTQSPDRMLQKEYAIAWDAYFNDITATRRDEQMAAARRETVEQAEQLHALIKQEIEYAIQPRALLAIDLQGLQGNCI